MKSKRKDCKQLLFTVILIAILFLSISCIIHIKTKPEVIETERTTYREVTQQLEESKVQNRTENTDFVYLSDIPYIASGSSVGWGSITLDKNLETQYNNGLITLIVDGVQKKFLKGISAHATSTVIYNISDYNYDYFTSYIGVDASRGSNGNGVKFAIYTSIDGENWDLKTPESPQVMKGNSNAQLVRIDIKGAKYLKLYAHNNGNATADHAVYANAKLIKENYTEKENETFDFIKTVEEYENLIKAHEGEEITGEYELLILQRELVNNVGYEILQLYAGLSNGHLETIEWLFNDVNNLRLYIMGGKPDGTYYNSLTQLYRLYSKYKDDFKVTEVSKYGTVKGELYKRMAIALSLTHSQKVALWMQPGEATNQSDAVTRYAIFKKLYDEGKFVVSENIDITKWFESYNVEEMRFVMNNLIDDEEILWLNEYVQSQIEAHPGSEWGYLTPHPYMAYVWPNYGNPVFHDPERKDYWDEKYGGIFSKYGVTYSSEGHMVYKVWMNFRTEFGTGAVCGGISKTGSNIRTTHGIPAAVIGQPGHAAIIYYSQDNNGNGYWNIDNDVSGWTLSEKSERMLLGWGNASYCRGSYQVVYMALAQEVLNDYENFEKCEKLVMLANSYTDDLVKQEEILRKALEVQPINIDAWYALINVYNASENKTENDYFDLAKELSESLKCFPLPMYQLSNLIKPRLTSIGNAYRFTLLQTRILTEASTIPNNSEDKYYVYQPSLTRGEANFLLGKLDKTIATFSFDGEDAEKIVLSSRFDGNGIRWDYSLDGKQTWKEISFTGEEEHKLQLTREEIESITAENDIYVHIVGVNYDEENLYKIDIKDSAGLPSTLYANDQENRMIAAVPTMQWKYKESDPWKYYRDSEPDLTGDKTIIVRMGATGEYLEQKTSTTFTFTADNDPDTRKYIPIADFSLHQVSSEATSHEGAAVNALDGNANTRYHSNWSGGDTDRYMVIKLNEPTYISAVEFIPAGGGNGKILDGTVYGSVDGESWEVLDVRKNWTYTNQANTVEDAIANKKSFEIENPSKVQYIKIVSNRSSGGNWFTARMFNLYKDITIKTSVKFSFDGPNAGKIMIDGEYQNTDWQYSLDNGTNWTNANGAEHKLTDAEINSINENDKIKVRIENKEYIINIRQGEPLQITPYVNDLENRLIGITDVERLEWRFPEENTWKSYSEEEPVVTGDRKLLVRAKANGIYTASDILEYQFTADNQPDTEKYVPIKYLSIEDCSTESPNRGEPVGNAIDGNINTMWHTNHTLVDDPRFIIISLDEPRFISKMQYARKPGYAYGVLKDGIISTSMDGENWEEAVIIKDLYNPANKEELLADVNIKDIPFGEAKQAKYIKIQCTKSCDYVNGSSAGVPYDYFLAASMLNVFEDATKGAVAPRAEIRYSTTTLTNKDVVVTLTNPSTEITITNNDGKSTYTFTENGEFTFEFVDNKGTKGKAKAVVNWIDKEVPVGIIQYDLTELTNRDVTATLSTNEDVIVVNNNGRNTYTFTENGQFEFIFRDEAGNEGRATAEVDWIDKEAPEATITYDITEATNRNVTATIECDEEIIIVNNTGLTTYTFTENGIFEFIYRDRLGNEGRIVAKVDWIDREAPIGSISYDITEFTGNNVIATLDSNEEIIVTNNNGANTYVFTENGEFEFVFTDKAGNEGRATAEVDWIDKELPVITIVYDIKTITNKDVTARIESDREITITNNDGENEYTFTENGQFTFEYVTESGKNGRFVVKVNWIDKVAPQGTISYNIATLTNQNVIATLNCDEEIIVTNNNGNEYTFTENGEFEFIYKDKAGNESRTTAVVDWIDKVAPIANVSYDITTLTNKDVIATLNSDEEIIVTNNDGSKTYTFTENGVFEFIYTDKAGNEARTLARVNWIDKEAPNAILTYDITTETDKNVTVTLNSNEEITILNNDGKNTYTFTENGTFEFIFRDNAGNETRTVAVVNWIVSKPDDNKPDDNKPDDNKPDDNKPDDNKPNDNKPEDNKPTDSSSTTPNTGSNGNSSSISKQPQYNVPKTGVSANHTFMKLLVTFGLMSLPIISYICYRKIKKD